MFPGLWLNVPQMIAGTVREVSQSLYLGCGSPEHAEFVKRLNETAPD
jgi:hypothetical protein